MARLYRFRLYWHDRDDNPEIIETLDNDNRSLVHVVENYARRHRRLAYPVSLDKLTVEFVPPAAPAQEEGKP